MSAPPPPLDLAELDAALRPRRAVTEKQRHATAAARLRDAERAARGL